MMTEYLAQLISDCETPEEAAKQITSRYFLSPTEGPTESLKAEIRVQIDFARTSDDATLNTRSELIAQLLINELDRQSIAMRPLIHKLQTSQNIKPILAEIEELL